MAAADDNTPQGAASDGGLGPLSPDLESLIRSCADVEEFRALLASRGIWLNRKAAESAFATLHRGDELDDDELDGIVGGVTTFNGRPETFLDELFRLL